MGLLARIEKAREGRTLQAVGYTRSGEKVTTSPWVEEAGKGARIGQPLNGRGLPVRMER